MTTHSTRYKISFYIHPEHNQADGYATAVLTAQAHGDRARLQRAAMLAGLALHKIEPRMPFLLAELLNSGVTADEMLQVMSAALPGGARLTGGYTTPAPAAVAEAPAAGKPEAEARTRANAMGIFGRR